MLLGVPVFVVIYTGITILVERKLKKRSLPVDPDDYADLDHIDPVTREPVKCVAEDEDEKPAKVGKGSEKEKEKPAEK